MIRFGRTGQLEDGVFTIGVAAGRGGAAPERPVGVDCIGNECFLVDVAAAGRLGGRHRGHATRRQRARRGFRLSRTGHEKSRPRAALRRITAARGAPQVCLTTSFATASKWAPVIRLIPSFVVL